jgi:hypothetical protein
MIPVLRSNKGEIRKMNSKKAITLLLLAIMLLAIVPVVPVSAAIAPDAIGAGDEDVVYDDTVTITGDGVTPGSTVELYWDYVQAWDGEAGLVGSDTGLPSGDFEIEFDVPEAVVGEHYLWVKDVSTGETVIVPTANGDDAWDMMPSIELSNDNGLQDETITIEGYGFNSSSDVEYILFWNFTDIYNLTAGLPDSDDLGSWTDDYAVPDDQNGVDWLYGDYNITVGDEWGNTAANVSFTIGPSISLDKEEGPSGTVVKVEGKGFTDGNINQGDITYNTTACYIKDTPVAITGGEFTAYVVIPSDNVYSGEAADIDYLGSGAEFECTGVPEIEADPEFQVQGGRFTVTGTNYTQISGEEVKFYLNGTELGTVDTESDGTFEVELRVPAVTSGVYELWGEMDSYNINSSIPYRVGIMLVILSEESGASGSIITVTATGFTADGTWNMTIGGETPDPTDESNDCDAEGSLSQEITIPTLPVGVHTVSVYDIEAEIAVETEFEVTHTTVMEADPYEVPVGLKVTLTGEYFSDESSGSALTFQIYNETDLFDIVVFNETDNPIQLLDDGTFEGTWLVGGNATIDGTNFTIGTYTINVTDGKDLYAELTFNVVDKTVSIEPRKSVFRIGDTVAYNVESSFILEDSYINIYDPSGELYWVTNTFDPDLWVSLELTKIVPFYSQTAGGNPMLLLDDAPLGEYTWEWYDWGEDEEAKNSDDELLDEGTFTVEAAAADVIGEQVEDLANDISDLADQLTDVSSDFSSLESDIADVASVAADAVAAAEAAAEAVTAVAATANTASEAAANAAEAAEAARDAASGLTTLVYGAIGAALVAALAAIVSLMQISRRIAG